MRTFNLIQFLMLTIILCSLSIVLIQFLGIKVIDDEFIFSVQIERVFEDVIRILSIISLFSIMILLLILIPEIISRVLKDSLVNLFKSIFGTKRFRRFLIHHDNNQNKELEDLKFKNDPVINQYNRAVKKSVLDIREEELLLLVKIPKGIQSQKIFKEYEEEIKEHIASLYPDYLVSTFQRYKLNLWLIGTKRK